MGIHVDEDNLSKVLCPWKHEKPVAVIDGIKWWKDKDTNNYIEKKFNKSTREVDLHAWFVEHESGALFRVLTRNNKVIYETTSYESILVRIDIYSQFGFNVIKPGHE